MGKNVSFPWEGIINAPDRQADIDANRAEKECNKAQFHAERRAERKEKIQFQAGKYLVGALAAGIVAYFVGTGGISWLAWCLVVVGAILAGISIYGFGRVREMGKR